MKRCRWGRTKGGFPYRSIRKFSKTFTDNVVLPAPCLDQAGVSGYCNFHEVALAQFIDHPHQNQKKI